MRHARSDYNRIQDPARIIPEGEPVFLVRARDKVAPLVVREWAKLNYQSGGDMVLSESARKWAEEMERWQAEHGFKLADVPLDVRKELAAQVELFGETHS